MARLTKLYTRAGDGGTTRLAAGEEVSKDSARVEAYGAVDELNACVGQALATGLCERLTKELAAIQNRLFDLGGDLATGRYSANKSLVANVIGGLAALALRRRRSSAATA